MSEPSVASPLRRLHRALVRALRERDPAGLGRPFTVAEIYQDLVPYRTHRDVIGVAMNGDYEQLLLRLLSGEDDLVKIESDHARREIAQELARPNPNTGLYRDYAAVDVHLVASRIPIDEEAAVILPANGDWGAEPEPEPSPVEALAPEPEAVPTPPAEAPDAKRDGRSVCPWCREGLPARDHLNFCPYCGTDMSVVPCGGCGEAVEPGWRFCIQCGAAVGDG